MNVPRRTYIRIEGKLKQAEASYRVVASHTARLHFVPKYNDQFYINIESKQRLFLGT